MIPTHQSNEAGIITEAVVKTNHSLHCAPSSRPSFQTSIDLEFLNQNEVTFKKILSRIL